MSRESQDRMLEILREQVEQTRTLYNSAKEECEQVRHAQINTERRAQAVRRTLLLYESLQQIYQRSLRLYNEHLLRNLQVVAFGNPRFANRDAPKAAQHAAGESLRE